MEYDQSFISFFDQNIRQVFIYITSRCQLHCRQCLYKPLLGSGGADIDYETLKDLLTEFHLLGAFKVSFLGGEPTLYRDEEHKKNFADVLKLTKQIGFKYVRFDTNGQFDEEFLKNPNFAYCDEITFSMDGYNKELNDCVRGQGSFDKCIKSIRTAVNMGYKTQITMCVHKQVCPNVYTGINNIEKMIDFAGELGVSSINFHPILKVGIARDNWIDNTNITPETWMDIYNAIQNNNNQRKYKVDVRLPMRFVTGKQYEQDKAIFEYCPLRKSERALIMPDGTIKVCAFTIGTPYHVAEYNCEQVHLYNGKYSEYNLINVKKNYQYCIFQQLNNKAIVPLCMSYKPHQNEIVWNYDRGEQEWKEMH